jgi:hypothetical protein
MFCAAVLALNAQVDFKIDGRDVQVHGFFSQGFLYSGAGSNNYLTTDTSRGSFSDTEGGLNVSTQITDNLRVGAQVYDRNIGRLGNFHPQLDWAVASYRFKDWFRVRGGKVKTTFGLYNDSQDQDFLHTFALMPQSIYPTDLRDALIAHTGGDVYGDIAAKHFGTFSYTVFAGNRKDTMNGGYPLSLLSLGINMKQYGGLQYGADLKWTTPIKGLLLGASRLDEDITGTGTWANLFTRATVQTAYQEHSISDWADQFYGQYTRGNFRLDSEYRRWLRNQMVFNGMMGVVSDTRSWYTAAAYRIAKPVEIGAYYSDMVTNWGTKHDLPNNHVYDKVAAVRVDLTSFWNVKVEAHFMDGYGGTYPDGFYTFDNPQGLKPKTNLLVIKTGFYF